MPLIPLLAALALSSALIPTMAKAQRNCETPAPCPEGEIRDPQTGICGPLLST
ncbi:MAG: hypothetical protein ACK4GT_07525 [Pararhodobacter sp.]